MQPLTGTPPTSSVAPEGTPATVVQRKITLMVQKLWNKVSPSNLSTSPTQKTLLQIQEEQYLQQVRAQVQSHKTKDTKPLDIQSGYIPLRC